MCPRSIVNTSNYGVYMDIKKSLTLQDLALILDILNVASTRNAFRIEEYSAVGTIFQKLSDIIQASNAQQQAADQKSEETKND